MLDRIKELLHGIIYIWWGAWTIFVFSWIGIFSEMRAVEPTHWILLVEWVTCASAIGLGVERLVKDIKDWR